MKLPGAVNDIYPVFSGYIFHIADNIAHKNRIRQCQLHFYQRTRFLIQIFPHFYLRGGIKRSRADFIDAQCLPGNCNAGRYYRQADCCISHYSHK